MTLFIVLYVWGSNPCLPPPLSTYLENCNSRKKIFHFCKVISDVSSQKDFEYFNFCLNEFYLLSIKNFVILELSEMNNLKLVQNKREFLMLKKVSVERSLKARQKFMKYLILCKLKQLQFYGHYKLQRQKIWRELKWRAMLKVVLMLLKEVAPLLHSLSNL